MSGSAAAARAACAGVSAARAAWLDRAVCGLLAATPAAMVVSTRVAPLMLALAAATALARLLLTDPGGWRRALGSILDPRPFLRAAPPVHAAAALLAVVAASLAWSIAPERTATIALRLALIGLCLVPLAAWRRRAAPAFLPPAMAAGLAAGAVALAAALAFRSEAGALIGEALYDFHFNRPAVVLAVLAPAVLAGLLAAEATPLRLALAAALAIGVAAPVLLGGSESAKLALAFGLPVLVGVALAPRLGVALAAVATAAAMVLSLIVLPQLSLSEPPAAFDAFARQGNLYERLEIWASYAPVLESRPLLGVGANASQALPVFTFHDVVGGVDVPRAHLGFYPHSVPLHLAVEIGWLGLGLATLFVLASFGWLAGRHRIAAAGGAGTIAAALGAGIAGHGAFQEWWIATLGLCALLVADVAARLDPGPRGEASP